MNTRLLFYLFTLVVLISLIVGCTNQENASDKGGESVNTNNSRTPPNLTISVDDTTFGTVLGSYSWSYSNSDGTSTGIHADSAVPPFLVQGEQGVNVNPNTEIELNFPKMPIDYQVRIWSEDNNVIATNKEVVFPDQKGRVIYEVLATWEQGTVSYGFVLNIEE
jgi:hypothetical protein